MNKQTLVSELCVALSPEEQQLLAGGVDFKLSSSNFANRIASLQGTVSSGPSGSTTNSVGQLTAINTAAQDLLALGAESLPSFESLGPAPVLNSIANNVGENDNDNGD
ncbi:CTB family bacteriocin [Nodularia chucula]|uniref:CTB family bacteriocin n=1 Tax=Nodularia chucula TaxID=3093667 RepID=UPI0039C66879